jgi:hypothetical protein
MGSNHSHVVLSTEFLAEAEDCSANLDDLGEELANSYEARRLRAHIGFALKMAEVHALLALAVNTAPRPFEPRVVRL